MSRQSSCPLSSAVRNTSVLGAGAITSGADSRAIVWDAANGLEELRLEGHEDAVTDAMFVGKAATLRFITASIDGRSEATGMR